MREYEITASTADGTTTSSKMGIRYTYAQFHVVFRDGSGFLVTPTAGIVTLEISSDGDIWHRVQHGKFEAMRVGDPYEMAPTAIGQAQYARATMDGITGAATYTVTVQRW